MECKLYEKIRRGLALDKSEIKLLADIVREELKFLIRNHILPTPRNYERWFLVFCHALEGGMRLSDQELMDLYSKIYGDRESFSEVAFDIEKTILVLETIVRDLQSALVESSEFTRKKEKELSKLQEDNVTPILLELLMHVKDLKKQNERFLKRIEEQNKVIEELKRRIQEVQTEANMDPLTGLFNRRSLERAVEDLWKEFKKDGRVFSLILLDMDNFKSVNDVFGHAVGDLVLKRVAQAIRSSLRARDIVGRWGGDEFMVLLPGTELEMARRIADRLSAVVGTLRIKVEGNELTVSLTPGVAQVSEHHTSFMDLFKEADGQLYINKKKKGKE
ncbi:diguanylate cyclase [Thermocrinis albus DSM 14484]|uniref:diguanylate cyclase n=1 Tax=Thermocrinis albus (strain DSM 14484 / JCM 11386 / HI 11/12) TaxID=638303 RepID=D3SLE6_THEAH|nr:diguanylate cyclase [Thermocrinis albus]ADC89576.1 diguanylate cyclase [Thermocrinis albus DSM 14484]